MKRNFCLQDGKVIPAGSCPCRIPCADRDLEEKQPT